MTGSSFIEIQKLIINDKKLDYINLYRILYIRCYCFKINKMQGHLGQVDPNDIRKRIQDYSYGLKNLIHRGTISSIFHGINERTKQVVALKVINRNQAENRKRLYMIENYVNGKNEFSHCYNVVRCYDIFSTPNNCYIILQFCNEGDLQNMLTKRSKMYEAEAIPIFRDIVSGFRSFVQCNYIHRNLRPSNILIKDKVAKISDFSFMKKQSQNTHEKEQINAPEYTSYQALTEFIYSHKNDIWALGLILFQILHGCLPWAVRKCTRQEQIQQIKATDINAKIQKNLSEDLKDFIKKCLKINQKQRLNPTQFFNHPFILRIFESHHIPELPQRIKNNQGPDRYFKSNKDIVPSNNSQQVQGQQKQLLRNLGEKQLIAQINYMRFIYRLLQVLPSAEESMSKTSIGLRFLATKQMLSLHENTKRGLTLGQNNFNFRGWKQFMEQKEKIGNIMNHLNDYGTRYEKNRKEFQKLVSLLSQDKSLSCVADTNFSRSELLSILSIKFSLQQCRAVWGQICKKKQLLSEQQYQKYFNKEAFKLDYLITFYQLNCFLIDNFNDPQYFLRNAKMDIIIDNKPSLLEPSVKTQLQNKLRALQIIL